MPGLVTLLALLVMTGCTASPARARSALPPSEGSPRFPSDTKFFVPAPAPGATRQAKRLRAAGRPQAAGLIDKMESRSRGVWLTGGSPAEVQRRVRSTTVTAARQGAVPVLVAYNLPGRDCTGYSAGGAHDATAYRSWIRGFAAGLGSRPAVVILEPDSLGLLPSSCGQPASSYPFTDSGRYALLREAVAALTTDPQANVYLDGTHSAWQPVGTITQRLLLAGVRRAQGFFLNVSNYQPTRELLDYGAWVSDCIAMVTDATNPYHGKASRCASQYSPATQDRFGTWRLTTQWYARHMGDAVATTHFVLDTSRNGRGAPSMARYAASPFNQPADVVARLSAGSWCNPPGAGLGYRPTADTGHALVDAYLWVKPPGESDGQCSAQGGARAWDYGAYTRPGWPSTTGDQQTFDPLWGMVDPPAGQWFPRQALRLAELARPSL